jgi:hypothetical protein
VAGRPVSLQVDVGNLQLGGASASHLGPPQPIPTGQPVQFDGGGADLKFTMLRTVTTVKDINPQTNETVVTYSLSGGVASQRFEYRLTVSEPEGFAHYLIDFAFV